MFGNIADLAKLMGRAKEIQKEVKKMRDSLPTLEFSFTSSDGGLKATVSGDLQLKKLENLKGGALDPAKAVEAINGALEEARKFTQGKISELTGGIDLPGLF